MLKIGDEVRTEGRTYTVLKLLGRGANAAAFLAQCQCDSLSFRCILKEYAPQRKDDFETGKARFMEAGKMQNSIRQLTALSNQAPPVSSIFEANGTAYIDLPFFGGNTLDSFEGLTLPQYMEICRTAAKTVGYYHDAGYLVLDLKPENLFILQNTPDDTVTQLVEFIDYDSVRSIREMGENTAFSYTREWAAPEQCNPYALKRIGCAADIYTLGEIIFNLLFGRHSSEHEHRGFSQYPFAECKPVFRKYAERPDVQRILERLFRGTLRSSAANRFADTGEIVRLLDQLIEALNQKEYIVPVMPPVSPHFVGRETELTAVSDCLRRNHVLFVNGVGGIGKSTLIRNFISLNRPEYDVIVYLEFDGDMQRTFTDDGQLQISTVHREDGEPVAAYFDRKLMKLKQICTDKRVLFVVDNFSGPVTKDLSRILTCGYDTVVVSRNRPPANSFESLEIGAIRNSAELHRLIRLNLERQMTKEESACFDEIIRLVHGHTLVLELIARQIAAGNLSVMRALELIRENGFSRFSEEKIGNFKDSEEVYDTLSAIIQSLFDAAGLPDSQRIILKLLALLNVHGLEADVLQRFYPQISSEALHVLSEQGWIYSDKTVHLHPVIAETVQNWKWNVSDRAAVMEYYRKMADIYEGMGNEPQILLIVKEAKRYHDEQPEHLTEAMYLDLLGKYYDVLLGGNYVPYTAEEAEILEKMIESEVAAIAAAEQSDDSRKDAFLAKACLSMASVLIRSLPDRYGEAETYLEKAKSMIQKTEPEISENRCYLCTVSAFYFTLVKPDLQTMLLLMDKAEQIAEKVFPTDLELIDIIDIPKATCLFYHGELLLAADALWKAEERCRRYPDSIPYIDKRAELLNCQLDVYIELKDKPKCRELIAEIDRINETYHDQGICREIDPQKREEAGS